MERKRQALSLYHEIFHLQLNLQCFCSNPCFALIPIFELAQSKHCLSLIFVKLLCISRYKAPSTHSPLLPLIQLTLSLAPHLLTYLARAQNPTSISLQLNCSFPTLSLPLTFSLLHALTMHFRVVISCCSTAFAICFACHCRLDYASSTSTTSTTTTTTLLLLVFIFMFSLNFVACCVYFQLGIKIFSLLPNCIFANVAALWRLWHTCLSKMNLNPFLRQPDYVIHTQLYYPCSCSEVKAIMF